MSVMMQVAVFVCGLFLTALTFGVIYCGTASEWAVLQRMEGARSILARPPGALIISGSFQACEDCGLDSTVNSAGLCEPCAELVKVRRENLQYAR